MTVILFGFNFCLLVSVCDGGRKKEEKRRGRDEGRFVRFFLKAEIVLSSIFIVHIFSGWAGFIDSTGPLILDAT